MNVSESLLNFNLIEWWLASIRAIKIHYVNSESSKKNDS